MLNKTKTNGSNSSVNVKVTLIKRGCVTVKIYASSRIVRGVTYPLFTVAYYGADGSRIRKNFADGNEARREAELVAAKLSRGQSEVLTLTNTDREQYLKSLDLLKPLHMSLAVAVDEFIAAKRLVPPGITLLTAMEEYAKRHAVTPRTVPEVVGEMLEDKKASGCSSVHVRDLAIRLKPFARIFPGQVTSITANQVREYLRGLQRDDGRPAANRTKRNVQRIINSLFHFARRRRYVLRETVDEICEIEPPKVGSAQIGIFTPEQMTKILNVAPAEVIPALAIGAFCGLRTAELQRLDWNDVKLGERVIVVGAEKAKTATRRVVPISENCALWLTRHANKEGPVSPAPYDKELGNRFERASVRVGVKWVKNGLRHSFCSYRLAVTHDPAHVATEAGNSPNMVHRHYKALVTEKEGKEWFSINPSGNNSAPQQFRNASSAVPSDEESRPAGAN